MSGRRLRRVRWSWSEVKNTKSHTRLERNDEEGGNPVHELRRRSASEDRLSPYPSPVMFSKQSFSAYINDR